MDAAPPRSSRGDAYPRGVDVPHTNVEDVGEGEVESREGAPTDSREHPRPKPDQNLAKSVVLQDPQDFPAAPPTAPKGQCPEGAHRKLGPRNMSHCGWPMACTIGEVMCQPSHPPAE